MAGEASAGVALRRIVWRVQSLLRLALGWWAEIFRREQQKSANWRATCH
ncbi:MAG TPA: hypothetical protein PLV92_08385 [Pirellulaceae bacterium]|nr:hypothetical protein [Pirellulaceae bacterium]